MKPLSDRVLIRQDDAEAVTPGGIVLPDISKEKPQFGTVLSVGPGKRLRSGAVTVPAVKQGDRVIFSAYSGTITEIDGVEHVLVSEADILATM